MAVVGFDRADAVHRVGAVVVEDAAVVAGEDDERVVGQLQLVELGEHLANGPVELDDGVAADAALALAAELRVRHARDVDVVRGHFEEERLVSCAVR